ncbi:MAG TPA: bifunctional diguanylate cyclase/phosphodiesterase [Gammaproteobacteria bacterium]|nr:bifunctional diguanylate cyclase/phosphodiesterase [Gammaproteobacteria bacterium]
MPEQTIDILLAMSPTLEPAIRAALGEYHRRIEFRRCEHRGQLASALDERLPDLVISELELRDFDALELASQLHERDPHIPVILVAERGDEQIALACLEAGLEHCILRNDAQLRRVPALVDALLRRADRERARQRMKQRLIESEERYLDIFDNTSDLIQCIAADGSFIYTNRAWRETMGYDEQEVRSLNLTDVLHPDSLACCTDRFEKLKCGARLNEIDFKYRTKDGRTIHLAGDCGAIIKDGEAVSTRGIFRNITDQVNAEKALRASQARYQALYENAPDIYTTINAEGIVTSINRTGAHLLGYEADELVGESAARLIHPADQSRVFSYIEHKFRHPEPDSGIEYRKVRKDGSILWVHQRVSLDPDNAGAQLLVVCRDVTERRELEDQLAYQATHDALTNLINRREFDRRLRHILSRPRQVDDHHVLCYLDLDQFKVINDTCGHIAGDELLRQIASLLKGQIRARDTLARLGGDEFAVLMEHCPLEKARALAERMREVIDEFCFQWQTRRFSIGVSIGVVPLQPGSTLEDAMSLADSACYAAKEQGRNRIHICHADDDTVAARVGEMHWATGVSEALDEDRFLLYAQPILPCNADSSGRRCEILLRLREGNRVIRPGTFMPAAERYNLSTRLDRWVLEHVIRWFDQHRGALEMLELCSINLSALSLCDPAFRDHALKQLDAAPFLHNRLCFEITETAAISNLSQAVEFIEAFRKTGCHFALDDFGSGLSSLAYLKNLPVDMVKIDGIFVRNISDNDIDRTMVRSVCEIAAMMGKQTTAEYVENARSLEILTGLGVDFVQGYHLGEPVELERLAAGWSDDSRVVRLHGR